MIAFNELLHGHLLSDVPLTHQHNLEELLKRINMVRDAWDQPMIVTSGYRSLAEHENIYRKMGISSDKVPMGSKHLTGQAVDISDPDGQLQHWLRNDPKGITIIEQAGLWCEDGTTNWVHFQWVPPGSGNRWFKP
jgi:uncharacterized protein YcbK (DUF882 family)